MTTGEGSAARGTEFHGFRTDRVLVVADRRQHVEALATNLTNLGLPHLIRVGTIAEARRSLTILSWALVIIDSNGWGPEHLDLISDLTQADSKPPPWLVLDLNGVQADGTAPAVFNALRNAPRGEVAKVVPKVSAGAFEEDSPFTSRSRDEAQRLPIPAASGERERATPPMAHRDSGVTAPKADKGSSGTVLVIDDSEMTLRIMENRLRFAGFTVHTTTNPICARLIQETHPDVILLDVMMPGVQGNVTARIFTQTPGFLTRCVLLLHSDLPEQRLLALSKECGVAGIIHKSMDPQAFVVAIGEWVERARADATSSAGSILPRPNGTA